MDLGYALIFFIIILIIIIGIYVILLKNEVKYLINELPLETSRECKYGIINSSYLQCKANQTVVFIGEIPQDYIYWSIGVYRKNGTPYTSINMGKYQTVHPGSNIAIICSINSCAISETKKFLECNHYKKYPCRRLYFGTVNVSNYLNCNDSDDSDDFDDNPEDRNSFYIRFECYFRNGKEHVPKFFLYEYSFENIYYNSDFHHDFSNIFDDNTCHSICKNQQNQQYYRKKEHYKMLRCIREKYSSYCEQNVICDIKEKDDLPECLTNASLIFEVTPGSEIIVIAIDHFMSRSAIHSNVTFINADTDIPYHIYYTGVVSRKINNKTSETFHLIKSKVPEEVYRIQIVEKLFYQIETGNAPKKETIVPMIIYTIK